MGSRRNAQDEAPQDGAPEQEEQKPVEEQNPDEADAGYTEEPAPTTDEGPTEEELEARRNAVIGAGTGFTAGPSQAELNPAYAPDAFDVKGEDDSEKE